MIQPADTGTQRITEKKIIFSFNNRAEYIFIYHGYTLILILPKGANYGQNNITFLRVQGNENGG